ncbi:hypothetical protein N7476_008697 [Penicillium atrosanguineum]|uniref:Uncharacterized protein n=1 Tax=Penicillium atrosanguineum TaxID=1132637 RepID=A0A9W9PSF8_9EURO|nr:hypothetical protein N7476_008697 [Penicillium atrosanguineum]
MSSSTKTGIPYSIVSGSKPSTTDLNDQHKRNGYDLPPYQDKEKEIVDEDGDSDSIAQHESSELLEQGGHRKRPITIISAWRTLLFAPSTYLIMSGILSAFLLLFMLIALGVVFLLSRNLEHTHGGIRNDAEVPGLDWISWNLII